MDALQFCYWMQGFAELSGDNAPTPEQWKSMREHLATVFVKVTPPIVKASEIKNAIADSKTETMDLQRQIADVIKRQQTTHTGFGPAIC